MASKRQCQRQDTVKLRIRHAISDAEADGGQLAMFHVRPNSLAGVSLAVDGSSKRRRTSTLQPSLNCPDFWPTWCRCIRWLSRPREGSQILGVPSTECSQTSRCGVAVIGALDSPSGLDDGGHLAGREGGTWDGLATGAGGDSIEGVQSSTRTGV